MTEAELDRIASGIRPSWELDDAPFRPAGFASPELDALLNGNGAHAVHTNGAAAAIAAQPIIAQPIVAVAVPQAASPAIELVEAPIAPAPKPISSPPPAPKPVAAPPPTPAERLKNGIVPPAAQSDPFAIPSSKGKRTSSAELAPMKKSSSGLWIAIVGGLAAVGIAAYLFSTSSNKTETVKQEPSAQQLAASAARQEIPPPPATDEIPAQPAATAKPTATAADTTADTTPAPTATTPPQPTQTSHASHNAEPPAPHHATTSHTSNPPPSGGGGGGKKGGIVRDVPF